MKDNADVDQSELIVHVGLPKTGTTAIQRYMYSNRDALAKEGVFWAETYPNGIHPINDWAHHVYSHKWGGWLDPASFPVTPDEAWQALGEAIRSTPGRYVISSERFADLLPLPIGGRVLRFMQDTAAPARVTVIGYVRRQDNLIESHIKELIKGGRLKKTIEEYLADLPSFVSFEKSFLNAAEALGRDNVIIRIYERGRLIRRDVVSDFLNVCGIPEVADPHDNATVANPSLNTLSGKVLSDPRIIEAFAGFPYRAKYVSDLLSRETFDRLGQFALLGPEIRKDLMDRFEAGNAQLIETFFDEDAARALEYDPGSARPSLADDAPILTYDELVELLLALRPPHPDHANKDANK